MCRIVVLSVGRLFNNSKHHELNGHFLGCFYFIVTTDDAFECRKHCFKYNSEVKEEEKQKKAITNCRTGLAAGFVIVVLCGLGGCGTS